MFTWYRIHNPMLLRLSLLQAIEMYLKSPHRRITDVKIKGLFTKVFCKNITLIDIKEKIRKKTDR